MKAVFSDMDGTLLSSEHVMTARTRNTLSALHDRGIPVVFASGRAYDGMLRLLETLPFTPFMATLNGAYIIDGKRRPIASFPLASADLLRISDAVRKLSLSYLFFYGEHWGADADNHFYRNERSIVGVPGLIGRLEKLAPVNEIHKVIAAGEPDAISKALPVLCSELSGLSVSRSSPNYIEINRGGINKGKALGIIADYLGIRTEDTIAFGDYDNDIEMLEMAGDGVAMANSSPAVLSRISRRTLSNDEDGVAVFLGKYFKI